MRKLLAVALLSTLHTGVAAADAPEAPAYEQASADRIATAHGQVERLREHLARMQKGNDEAVKEKDIIKINFLADKLKSAQGLLKVAEQAARNLQQALLRHDLIGANHEEEKLNIIGEKVTQLAMVSQSAVGELAVYSGDTKLDVVMDERVTGVANERSVEAKVSQAPTANIAIERPPAASPYQ